MINLEEYLNSNINNSREISNTQSFYEKFGKFNTLYGNIQVQGKLFRAQGKYNSHICFIFKNEEHYKSCLESLKRILPVYNIDIWDVLILFSEKTDDDNINTSIISNEIIITNPFIIYIFDDNNLNKKILQEISKQGVLSCRIINVNNIDKMLNDNISSDIFDLFKYLLTYNY